MNNTGNFCHLDSDSSDFSVSILEPSLHCKNFPSTFLKILKPEAGLSQNIIR